MVLLKDNARFRFLFLIDALLLLVVIVSQAAFLDYVFVKHSQDYIKLCIFIALDVSVIATVIRAFLLSYRYFSQKHQDFPDGSGKNLKPKWYKRGILPMSYFSWFLYIVVLLAKLLLICLRLDVSKENPQVLQVSSTISEVAATHYDCSTRVLNNRISSR